MKNIFEVIKSIAFGFNNIFAISKRYVVINIFDKIFNAILPVIEILLRGILISKITTLAIFPNKENLYQAILTGALLSLIALTKIPYNYLIDNYYTKYQTIIPTRITNKYNKIIIANIKMQDYERTDFKYNKNYIDDIAGTIFGVYQETLNLIEMMFGFISTAIIIISIKWWLIIPVIACVIVSSKCQKLFADKSIELRMKLLPSGGLNSHLRDVLTKKAYIEELKMFNLREFFTDLWSKTSTDIQKAGHKLNVELLPYRIIIYILNILGSMICLTVAVIKVLMKTGTTAELSIAYDSSNSIIGYISGISEKYGAIIARHHEIKIVETQLDEIKKITNLNREELNSPFKNVKFDNVSFSYSYDETYALKDVSFELNARDYTAIVGKNGSGKTTLCMLICGLYQPTKGTIYYNEVPHTEINPKEIYEKATAMFQDFFKYALSISENITFKEYKDILKNRFNDAVEKSNTHKFIDNLPESYDTELLPEIIAGASDLSIGQWQRISAARALYKESEAIFFDEPASALDANAEKELYEVIINHNECDMKVVITHQLSSIKKTNRILLLDSGQLIADSNFDKLISYDNIFSQMFKIKAERYNMLT